MKGARWRRFNSILYTFNVRSRIYTYIALSNPMLAIWDSFVLLLADCKCEMHSAVTLPRRTDTPIKLFALQIFLAVETYVMIIFRLYWIHIKLNTFGSVITHTYRLNLFVYLFFFNPLRCLLLYNLIASKFSSTSITRNRQKGSQGHFNCNKVFRESEKKNHYKDLYSHAALVGYPQYCVISCMKFFALCALLLNRKGTMILQKSLENWAVVKIGS